MKNLSTVFLSFAMLIAFPVMLLSCSSDDDGPEYEASQIVSQWTSSQLSIQFQAGNKLAGWTADEGIFTGSYSLNEDRNAFSYDIKFANGTTQSGTDCQYQESNGTLSIEFCGNNYNLSANDIINNSIIGMWELVNYNQFPSFYTINILSNGCFEVIYEPGESKEPGGFEWKAKDNQLILYFDTEYGHDDYLIGEFVVIGDEMRYSNNYGSEDSSRQVSTFIMRRVK